MFYFISQTINIINIADKYFILNLSTNKLCKYIKKNNKNFSEFQLLNIEKLSQSDINLLKIDSFSINELYKKTDEIDKYDCKMLTYK